MISARTHSGNSFICSYFTSFYRTNFISYGFRCAHTFPKANNNVRFNRRGTRLLCKEVGKLPTVYNVPQEANGISGKVQFSSQGYVKPTNGRNLNCFAGQDDELVVAASADHGLYVWSLPTDQQVAGDQVVDQPLVVLRGHKDEIYSVRYNRQSGALASAGKEKTIRLCTPIAQQ